MKHNITKSLLALVISLLALPMQSQDYMNIFFKDGSFRKFYLKNVIEIAPSKIDAQGVSHGDYDFQHITTIYDKYIYKLEDVDSITFTKINEALAEQNFVSAMPKVISAIDGCKTIDEVESKVDEIKSAEGVADAWSDGHQLYVTIAEDETYSIHFNHDAPESEDFAAQVREIKTRASKIAKKEGTPLKAVIVNQQHKDESRAFMVEDYYMPLIACLQECGIQVDYVKEPTIDFFYNNSNDPEHLSFYDYDIVYLKTHGSYQPLPYYRKYEDPDGNQYRYAFGMKGHGFETSDDIAELKDNYWYDNYKTFKKWRDSTPYHDLTDVQLNYTIQNETRNGKEVYIAHPFLTEYFFRDIALGRFKNPNSFLFNSVCESLKGDDEQVSYSFANILFGNRDLGVYAGYTRSDYFGYETGPYLFLSLLCGGSLDKSFDDLPDYCKFESLANIRRYTKGYSDLQDLQNFRFNVYDLAYYTKEGTDNAELKIFDKSGDIPSDFFLFPTTTVEIDNNDINKEYSKNKTITLEGYSTHLDEYKNPWEDYGFKPSDIEIGFEMGESSNLGPSFAVRSSIKKEEVNSEYGKYHFLCTIPDLEPGKTYHYRAYTFDGKHYNYGKPYSFTIENDAIVDVETILSMIRPLVVTVEGGSFTMGATDGWGYDDERPTHEVNLSTFKICSHEVTQKLWVAIMGSNPSTTIGDNLPVNNLSWDECQTFIERLNALVSEESGITFRLPTEAEWEYAARGGKSRNDLETNKSNGYQYAGGYNSIKDMEPYVWCSDNSDGSIHPVGTKKPNELGLYDMSGNVCEYVQDYLTDNYTEEIQTNPKGALTGVYRVFRGGSYERPKWQCRLASRFGSKPDEQSSECGLRLVLTDSNSSEDPIVYTSCPNNNHPHAIDLGLPSGTLWACCNVGASKPDDYGGYYAWGEVEEKDCYNFSTYTHCDGSVSTIHDIGSDISDTGYDVAHIKWGGEWAMPNNRQIDELYKYCTLDNTAHIGVNGLKFTGPNDHYIFLPASGEYMDSSIRRGEECVYWSSQLSIMVPETAYYWGTSTIDKGRVSKSHSRCVGKTVRPVYKKKQ